MSSEIQIIEFNESDVELLDFILDEVSKSDIFTVRDLIKKHSLIAEKDSYSISKDFDYAKEFERLLSIINSYEICECSFKEDVQFVRKSGNTLQFIEQGGFRKQYKKNEEQNSRAARTSFLTKLKIYTIGPLFFLTVVSTYYVVRSFKKDQSNQEYIEKIEQELTDKTVVIKQLKDSILDLKKVKIANKNSYQKDTLIKKIQ